MLLVIIFLCITNGRADNSIFTNLPLRFNLTNAIPRKVYLPPEPPNFMLPEVIDNRLRIPISSQISTFTTRPSIELQTPFANSNYYPMYGLMTNFNEQKSKFAPSSNFFKDSSTNEVTINDMSCQNSGEDLFFRYA